MYPIIHFFGKEIGSYALLSVIGLVVCAVVIYFTCRRIITIEDSILLILVTAAGLLIGGHLLYGIVNISGFITSLQQAESLTFRTVFAALMKGFGGMVFYGGFLGGLAALAIYRKLCKQDYAAYAFDIYAFATPLFHVFGRLGCFFAGCCYGIEWKYGFTVTDNPFVPEINGVPRFPVALLEAFCNLCIFALILTLFQKKRFQFKLIYLYMLIYPVCRFFLEFLRGDAVRGVFGGLSTSQWISIVLFCVALIRLILSVRPRKPSEV